MHVLFTKWWWKHNTLKMCTRTASPLVYNLLSNHHSRIILTLASIQPKLPQRHQVTHVINTRVFVLLRGDVAIFCKNLTMFWIAFPHHHQVCWIKIHHTWWWDYQAIPKRRHVFTNIVASQPQERRQQYYHDEGLTSHKTNSFALLNNIVKLLLVCGRPVKKGAAQINFDSTKHFAVALAPYRYTIASHQV